MTTIDGYFSQRPMPTQMIYLEDHEPTKVNPEIDPQEEERLRQREQYGYSESELEDVYDARSVDDRSIDESLPDYESRRGSGTFTQEIDEHGHIYYVQRRAHYQPAPQAASDCACGNAQCIPCAINGRAAEEHRRLQKRRKSAKRKCRVFKLLLAGMFVFSMICGAYFSHNQWKRGHHGHHKSKKPTEFAVQNAQCPANIPYSITPTFNLECNETSAFSFKQYVTDIFDTIPRNMPHISIEGKVEIRSATAEDDVAAGHIRVVVDVMMSDDNIEKDLAVFAEPHGVVIKSNRTLSTIPARDDPYTVCAKIMATIIVPKADDELTLDHFDVLAETLSIGLKKDLGLTVNSRAVLESVTGEISSMHRPCHDDEPDACEVYTGKKCEEQSKAICSDFKARSLEVRSISGEIHGDWAVAETASFETKSSMVHVGLYAAPELKDLSDEISITVESISGSVDVHPARGNRFSSPFSKSLKKYTTSISTVSGDIDGLCLLGTSLSLNSISGNIHADILPLTPGANHPAAKFVTDTKSGHVHTRFLSPTEHGGGPGGRGPGGPGGQSLMSAMGSVQDTLDWLAHGTKRLVRFFFDHEPGPHHHHYGHRHKNKNHHAKNGTSTVSSFIAMPLSMTSEESTPILTGTHNTISGEQWIHYPDFFQGTIYAKSLTGRVSVQGRHVEITHESGGFPIGKTIEAVKGEKAKGGKISVIAVSGIVDVCIGK